LTIDNLGG